MCHTALGHMSKLNIFVDGTWLLVQCAAGGSMANATDRPEHRFELDFSRLNDALLSHANSHGAKCDSIGEAQISTSIFSLPEDFDNWSSQFDDITAESIEKVRRGVTAREKFVHYAKSVGYLTDAVYYPRIRDHIIRRYMEDLFELWVEYYGKLSDEARRRLPLKPIYFLAPDP